MICGPPLTAMRVQAEMVDDDDTRDGLVRSVEEMQSMVEATLTFARGLTGNEAAETVEIGQFLQDMQRGAVAPFSLSQGKPIEIRFRPNAIRRALRNLIENAVRYGSAASVTWVLGDDDLVITVEDVGPGIPAENFDQVFDPLLPVGKKQIAGDWGARIRALDCAFDRSCPRWRNNYVKS